MCRRRPAVHTPKAHGIRILHVFHDEGVSGTLEAVERESLMSALTTLQEPNIDMLLAARLNRLARSLTLQEAVLAQMRKHNRAVHIADIGPVLRDDPDDPMRTAMRRMAGAFAQLDRGMVVSACATDADRRLHRAATRSDLHRTDTSRRTAGCTRSPRIRTLPGPRVNAHPELAARTRFRTRSNEEDGVVAEVERMLAASRVRSGLEDSEG